MLGNRYSLAFFIPFRGLSSLKTPESRILASSSSSQMPLSASSPSRNPFSVDRLVVVPAPSEPGKIVMHSPAYYAACTAGGILSCGLTHTAVTPLELGKCNMQAVGKLGLRGLFTRGLPLRIVMIGTLTGAQWGIYDSFKVFVGLQVTVLEKLGFKFALLSACLNQIVKCRPTTGDVSPPIPAK